MKTIMTIVLTLLAASAAAQQSQRRAPLAQVDNIQPAGGGTQSPRAGAQTPTPTAAAPPVQVPAEPSPQAADRPVPRVMDSLDLGTTSITGNAELPKVLYIVPWKKSDLGDLVGRPVNTLLDEVLAPVDPAVFERHLSYYDSLYGKREQE